MDAVALLRQALDAGLVVTSDGTGPLHVAGPKRLATLVQPLRQHKDTVRDVWEAFNERAALIEYDGGLSREEAERLAWGCVLPPTNLDTGTTQPQTSTRPAQGAGCPACGADNLIHGVGGQRICLQCPQIWREV